MNLKGILLGLSILAVTSNAQAVKIEGTFTAVKSCPAYQSFTKGHNPGDIHTIPGRTYEIVEENKYDGPWARVLVPELSSARRWVAKECGVTNITHRQEESSGDQSTPSGGNNCNAANTYDSYVLGLSWQAGFCEHYTYSGVKPECDSLNSGKISVTNITIHGLWPNKSGCGNNYGNCATSPLDLEEETISKIAPWMPNWYYSSDFGNHEWSKHGTCQKLSDDDYFLLMQRLAERFNQSPLGEYLRDNIGKTVRVNEMESYLTSNLGGDITKKIELRCTGNGKQFIDEFWINLPGELNESGTLAELVAGAKNKAKFRGNCADEIYIEAPGPH
jgi:ribonuclease T2